MDTESVHYWLPIIIGIPMAFVWFGIVAILAHLARKGDSPSLRRVAGLTVVVCGIVTATYSIFVVWHPAWYADWIGQLLNLLILVCFGVALYCLIWRNNPPRNSEERRLMIGGAVGFGILTVPLYVACMIVTEWYNVFFMIPYGILLAWGSIIYRKAERRIQNSHGAGCH
jgi:drug/metabolite transporter (DMT)-like permease